MTNIYEKLSWATRYKGLFVVYRLTWGGADYIGTSTNLSSRLYWWRSAKVPADCTVELVKVCASAEAMYSLETELIASLGTAIHGHNKTHTGKAGAVVGRQVSPETCAKIRAAKQGFKFSDAAKQKMSGSAKKRGTHSKESIARAAASNTGKVRTIETKQKISSAVKGKPKSAAHRAALKTAWVSRKLRKWQQDHETTLWAFGAVVGPKPTRS